MADPTIVACPAGAWTLVATAITSARVYVSGATGTPPQQIRHTYRLTGGAAPVNDVGVLAPLSDRDSASPSIRAEHAELVDLYVFPVGGAAEATVHEGEDGIGSVAALRGLQPVEYEFLDEATVVDPGAVYPSTVIFPDPAVTPGGYEFGERRMLALSCLVTGTAVPAVATAALYGSRNGGAFRLIHDQGFSNIQHAPGQAGCTSVNATPVEDELDFLLLGYDALQVHVTLPTGASGPIEVRGTFHGR